MKKSVNNSKMLTRVMLVFIIKALLSSCAFDQKEHCGDYLVVLDSNYRMGFTNYDGGLCVTYPEIKNCFDLKFKDLYVSTLSEVKFNQKWQFDMMWFEYPKRDSVYVKDFMNVLYTETIKVFPDDRVNVSEIDGTVYITIE